MGASQPRVRRLILEASHHVGREGRGRAPVCADENHEAWRGGRQPVTVLKILDPSPLSNRRVVDVIGAARVLPDTGGDPAVKHADHRPIVGKCLTTSTIPESAGNSPSRRCSSTGVVATLPIRKAALTVVSVGNSAGKRFAAVGVFPGAREDGDRVGGHGSGQGARGVGRAHSGWWDVVVAQDVNR